MAWARRDWLGRSPGALPHAGIAWAVGPWAGAPTARPTKRNLILILADDRGYTDLDAPGCTDIPTPNIDRIAKGGVRFTPPPPC